MNRTFQQTIFIPGALTADKSITFTTHHAVQLVHVSAHCITQDATLKIGNTSDDDAYLESTTVTAGASAVTELDRDDFVDDQYPHIASGTTVHITVGHGSNCVDLYVVLTFTEG